MKDKALRKLLKGKGLIHSESSDSILAWNWTTDNDVGALRERVSALFVENTKLNREVHTAAMLVHDHMLLLSNAEGRIKDLEAKFDAINKHYGISVEKQEAQYVVKEGE